MSERGDEAGQAGEERRSPARAVVVSGATGLVGSRLVPELRERFETIRTLSRRPGDRSGPVERHQWDGIDPGPTPLEGADAVVHLSGEPIFGGPLTRARRERIRESRVDSTRAIVGRIGSLEAEARPRTLVCASAVGYYGDRGETPLDEEATPGDGFLADVCREWEAAAVEAETHGVRVVRLRIGVVLSQEGGALALMRLPFSLGLGGRLGSGRQLFPWIHLDDLVGVILWALDQPVQGPVNAVAPEPVRNEQLTRELGRVLGRPTVLPVPGLVLRVLLGELANELLGSRRVVPKRLEEADFRFQHPTLADALETELG
ncbi:MAG TPA: TIGR01777 family oxidoreductase [Myxococcota bacterium]|nr:TIGR01777 family oxidoreductase [Myxococcota bacterium]